MPIDSHSMTLFHRNSCSAIRRYMNIMKSCWYASIRWPSRSRSLSCVRRGLRYRITRPFARSCAISPTRSPNLPTGNKVRQLGSRPTNFLESSGRCGSAWSGPLVSWKHLVFEIIVNYVRVGLLVVEDVPMALLPSFASTKKSSTILPSSRIRALLSIASLSAIVTSLGYIWRESVSVTESATFPCWTDAGRPLSATQVYKCNGSQSGPNHTIQAYEELSLEAGDFNSPWFHAASKLSLCWIPKVGYVPSTLAEVTPLLKVCRDRPDVLVVDSAHFQVLKNQASVGLSHWRNLRARDPFSSPKVLALQRVDN